MRYKLVSYREDVGLGGLVPRYFDCTTNLGSSPQPISGGMCHWRVEITLESRQ